MSESKGCLGWIAATIGWFMLWGLCMSIGDTYKISPFFVLLILVIGTLIIAGLCIYIYATAHGKTYNKHKNRVLHIQQEYSLAYRKFIDSNIIKKDYSGNITELSELKKISSREDSVWEQEEKQLREEKEKKDKEWKRKCKEWKEKADRIKKDYPDGYEKWKETQNKYLYVSADSAIAESEEQIAALDKHVKTEKWEKAQSEYASQCYTLSKQFLPGYGRYIYNIPFSKYDANGNEQLGTYKIWQFFFNSMCSEDLDYTYFKSYKDNASTVPGLKNKSRFYNSSVYTKIAQFIKEVAIFYCKNPNETISVIFNYDKDWDKNVLDFHYKALSNILWSDEYREHISCFNTTELLDYNETNIDKRILLSDDYIIIFDITTCNDEMKKLCENIINYDNNSHPVITYISLLKAFDRDEMISLIDRENQRQAKLKEEREKEERAKKNLVESVSSWDVLVGGLHYSYLFYYYPTTCDFEATEEEWSNRWIIWDFKNTPGKTSTADHQEALDKAIPMLKDKLLTTFEAEGLKYLTLVCIPASSQAKTKARYEEFSDRICGETGMINAYSHISVVTEREERHLGGSGMNTNQLSFDEDFFKGKYVLLFDDVITRGDSMRTFKSKMEALGAIVVGGLSLGKTKHERPIQANIPRSPFEFDDLPF